MYIAFDNVSTAKGKEVLLKDNLLDQEATEEGGESVDEKMKLIEQKIDALSERCISSL